MVNKLFFKSLYQYSDTGMIELRALPSRKKQFVPTDTMFGLNEFCSGKEDYYFGVALRTGFGGGTKADIAQFTALWTDVDFKDTPREILLEKVKGFPFKPSAIIKSGGGVHIYFILNEPVGLDELSRIEDANKRIAVALGGDLVAFEAARILRIPGTTNYKYDPPRGVELTVNENYTYSIDDFLNILPELQDTPHAVVTKKAGWLQEAMKGVPDGKRGSTAAMIAGYWINKIPPDDVLTILQAWNINNIPPLEDAVIRSTVKSVSRYEPEKKKEADLDNVYDSKRMVDEYKKYIATLKNNKFITGINEIDKRIRGVAGGEVLTIIARAGSFKTAMLQNLLCNYVKNSKWASVFFSIEMPVPNVTERYFGILDGCTTREVERMFATPDMDNIREAAERQFIKDLDRLFVIPTKIKLNDISKYIKLIEEKYNVKVGVVGIDYMGLIDGPGNNEYEVVSRIARDAKTTAKLVNLPVIILSQVSRKGGDGEVEVSLDMGRGCFDKETEILTEDGWKFFKELTNQDKVLSMDPQTFDSFYAIPSAHIKYRFTGDLLHFKNSRTNFMVTPNHTIFNRHERSHKWIYEQANKIKVAMIRIPRSFRWTGKEIKQFKLPSIKKLNGRYIQKIPVKEIFMDDWLDYLGWYFSEGCCCQYKANGYHIIISQVNKNNIEIIKKLLKKLPFNFNVKHKEGKDTKFCIYNKQLFDYLTKFGSNAINKELPRFISELCPRQIRIFLNSYMLGDGNIHKGMNTYYTASPKMADDLQELILKTGSYASVHCAKVKGTTVRIADHYATRIADMYTVTEWKKPLDATVKTNAIRKIKYDDYVYCVTVDPYHLIYVRRSGRCMWSGNSGAIEEGADFVLGLWQVENKDDYTDRDYDLICRILKNRKGSKGQRFTLEIDPKSFQFSGQAFEYDPPKKQKRTV